MASTIGVTAVAPLRRSWPPTIASVQPDRPLTECGLDSLIAVELMTALRIDLGLEIPVVKLLQGITMNGLVVLALEQARASETVGRPEESSRPTGSAGLVANELPVSASLPEKQYTLFFDDVRLGAGALIGTENAGFQQVFHGLNPERITGAAICVGVGRRALAVASEYARSREVWGVPIGTHQGVSHALAKAKIEVDLAALMTAKAAWLHDHDLPAGEASNEAKYAAAEAAIAAVDAAIQTHGGNGLSTEFGLLPLWGISRLLRIAPVSAEMVLNYVAQHSLGLPRSY